MKTLFSLKDVLPTIEKGVRFLRTKEDREDAIQDAFVMIWQMGILEFKEETAALIYSIVRRRAIAIYVKNKRIARYFSLYKIYDSSIGGFRDINDSPDDAVWVPESLRGINEEAIRGIEYDHRKALVREVWEKFPSLTPDQKRALGLVMMGCTEEEIGWMLGHVRPRVNSNIRRARENLIRRLNPEYVQLERDTRRISGIRITARKRTRRRIVIDEHGKARYVREQKTQQIHTTEAMRA